jgi:hypothetical protein
MPHQSHLPRRPKNRRAGIARAPDEGVKVHVGEHLMSHQPAVGLVVSLFDQCGHLFMQAELQLAPAVQAATG